MRYRSFVTYSEVFVGVLIKILGRFIHFIGMYDVVHA